MKKSHTSQVLESSIKLLSGQIGANIFLIGFGIYFAHVLELTDMAVLAVFELIGGVYFIISCFGINNTLIKEIPGLIEKGNEEIVKDYFMATLQIQSISLLLIFFVSLFFYRGISILFYKSVLPFLTLLIIFLSAIFQSLGMSMNSMLRAKQSFGQLSIVKLTVQIVSRILSILLFFVMDINGILIGFLLGKILGFIMYCYFLKDFIAIRKPSYILIKELIVYSLPFYGAGWLRYSIMNADKYFISFFFQPEQLALYHVANKIIGYIVKFMDSVANPITSKLAQLSVYGKDKIEKILNKIISFYSLTYIPLLGLLIAFSNTIIKLYGGEKYLDASIILILLTIGLIFAPFSGIIEIFVFILGKPLDRLKIRLFSGLFSLFGAYILMLLFKVYGIALSNIFNWLVYLVVGFILLRKHMKIIIDYSNVFRTIIITLFLVFGGLLIQFKNCKFSYIIIYILLYLLSVFIYYIYFLKRNRLLFKDIIPKKILRII